MSYRFGSSPNSHHRSIAVVVGMDDTTITTRLEPKTDGRSIAADRENRPPPLSLSTSMNIINNPTTRDNNNNNSEPPRSRGCGAEEEPNTTHNGWNSDMSLDTEGSLEDAPSASITIPTAAATTTAAVAEPNLPLVSTSSSPRTAPPRPTTTAVTTATLLDWKEPIRFNLTPLLPTLPKKTISSSSACTNKSNSANNHNNYSGNAPKSPHSSSSLVILEPPAVSITTNTIRSSDAATTRHQRPSMRLPPLTTTTRPNHHNSPAGMAASARGIPDSHQPEPEQPPPKLPTVVAQSQPSDPVHSSTTGGGLMLQSSNVRHFASSTLKATTPNKPPMVALSLVRCGGDHKPLSTHHTRPPLLVLKSFGLGKAARVDPSSQSAGLLDDSDSDGGEKKDKHVRPTPTGTTATTSSRRRDPLCHETTPPKKKTKLVKMDIDYMLNWDPEKRLATPQQKQQQHPDSLPQVTQQQQQQPQLLQSKSTLYGTQPAKISQQTPSVSLSSSSNTASGTSSSSSLSLSHGSNKEPSVVAAAGHSTSSGANSILAAESQKDNSVAARLTQANVDFLPLVLEENMIRVNGVPYAKLGVIGKGGSCKVYRALSKDLTVLAIKKVKLDDLDKKAIDGYSNEIALLKRLRGNPSIIQLHDSEVDRERKAIYLVMEQGEADLNHVLQRQTLGVGGSTKRNLDMNFIRLTWQVRFILLAKTDFTERCRV